jgi:sulfatase modifying factor 1
MRKTAVISIAVTLVLCRAATRAEVTIDLVPVGNPGNAGELSGTGAGDAPERICGAVGYAYNIGKYEVTAGQYRDFLNAADPTGANPYGLYNSEMDTSQWGCQITWNASASTYDFSGRPSGTEADWVNRPVNHVSWYDAAMFCNWLTSGNVNQGAYDTSVAAGWGSSYGSDYTGVTAHDSPEMDDLIHTYGTVYVIPSEDEWYKAAYYDPNKPGGAGYWDYPTKSDDPNVPSNNLIDPDPGNNATFWDDDYTIGGPYYRTEVGAHENSESPYGTFDQGGNVFEWNETILEGSDGYWRGLRGGDYIYWSSYLHANWRPYFYSGPTSEANDVGFRVASVPEPGSTMLLVSGAIAGLIWWRRTRAA